MVKQEIRSEYYQDKREAFDPEQAVERIPAMKLLLTSAEEGAIRWIERDQGPAGVQVLDIDFDHIDAITEKLQSEKITSPAPVQDISSPVEFVVPQDFDMHREAKEAMKYAMRTVYTSGILSLEKFRAVARFATPSNTRHSPDLPASGLFSITDYLDYLRATSRYADVAPLPESKAVRDRFIATHLGKEDLISAAEWLKKGYAKRGVDVDERSALVTSFRETAAHEWGHAVKLGLSAIGVDVAANARPLGGASPIQQLRKDSGIVLEEHFARAFGNSICVASLKEYLSPEQVALYEAAVIERCDDWDLIVNAFFNKAQNGFHISPLTMLFVDQQLQKRRMQKREPRAESSLSRLVYYEVTPYTMDEVKALAGN